MSSKIVAIIAIVRNSKIKIDMTIPIVVAVTVVDAAFISVEVVIVAASSAFDKFAASVIYCESVRC